LQIVEEVPHFAKGALFFYGTKFIDVYPIIFVDAL
jgi:hypothetical protein